MPREIDVRPRALADINEIAVHFRVDSDELGERFLGALTATLNLLAESAEIRAPRKTNAARLAGLRSIPVRDFRKYLLFYRPTPTVIEVVRVLHGARDLETELNG